MADVPSAKAAAVAAAAAATAPTPFRGPCADSPLGELFLDVIGLVAARGYAAEVSQCRALCGLTWRRGDAGATSDMIASSLRLQCGAAQARAARRESFVFAAPWGPVTLAGSTQLMRASILNNLPRVLQLIQLGAPPGLFDASARRWPALHWATAMGNGRVVAALLEGKFEASGGANVNEACGSGGWPTSALRLACKLHHAEVVRALLARGAAQVRPGETFTAMHEAVLQDRAEIVGLLLAAPGAADALGVSDSLAGTPLCWALEWGRVEIVALLRAAGATEE